MRLELALLDGVLIHVGLTDVLAEDVRKFLAYASLTPGLSASTCRVTSAM